jgi:hypothetical protein
MKVVVESELVSSLHFFSNVRKRADIVADVDDLQFWSWDWFGKMWLAFMYEVFYVGFDGVSDFGCQLVSI